MEDDEITAIQVTVALQALQIDALRAALGWRAAAEVERQLVELRRRLPGR